MNQNIQDDETDINLVDLLIALGQEKLTLISITFLAALIGVVVSLITPDTYVSRTTIMTNQQSGGSGGGGLASLSGLTGFAGLAGVASSIKSSDEMYIALMRSQSFQNSLIEQLKLKERYGSRTMEDARLALTNNTIILADKKSGLLLIDAQDKDPEFAAQLANAHVKELHVILNRLAVTEVQQRRAYYEQQILKTQAKIPQLELEFKVAQKSSGLEVASLLAESVTLPGQIAAKELQLQVLSRFVTQQNPELKKLVVEISALRSQMARYELNKSEPDSNEPKNKGKASDVASGNSIQKATQAYNTLKIQELLLDGFVKQLELAKVDEAKEGPVIQVVDEAKPPEMRSKPERKKLVLAYTVTGFIIGFVLAALRAYMRQVNSTPEGHEQFTQLKRAWGFA